MPDVVGDGLVNMAATDRVQPAVEHPPDQLVAELEVVRRRGCLAQDAVREAHFHVRQQGRRRCATDLRQQVKPKSESDRRGRRERGHRCRFERLERVSGLPRHDVGQEVGAEPAAQLPKLRDLADQAVGDERAEHLDGEVRVPLAEPDHRTTKLDAGWPAHQVVGELDQGWLAQRRDADLDQRSVAGRDRQAAPQSTDAALVELGRRDDQSDQQAVAAATRRRRERVQELRARGRGIAQHDARPRPARPMQKPAG